MAEWQNIPIEDRLQKYTRTSFYNIGRDAYTKPPAQNPDLAADLRNVLPVTTGVLVRRWGYSPWTTNPFNFGNATSFWLYENPSSGVRRIVADCFFLGGASHRFLTFSESGVIQNTSVWTFTDTANIKSRAVVSRNYLFHLNQTAADRFMYDGNDTSGSGTSTWGIAAPTGAASAALNGAAGGVTINRYRHYYYAYQNTTTGVISDISPLATGPAAPFSAQKIDITGITIDAAAATTGTNRRLVFATSDGGPLTRLYLLTTLADNITTVYTDNVAEETLLRAAVYADLGPGGERMGVLGNQPAPNGKYVGKHRGRIYIVGLDDKLYFSKSKAETSTASGQEIGGRYECCFPPENFLDISPEVETITGLLSDGIHLYVGTRRNVYRLVGDGPSNYEPPQIALHQIGVGSDKTWQTVFVKGTPLGAIWVTADYRVVFSDFNTYEDIGLPVRDSLDTLTQYSATYLNAAYVSTREFNVYALSLQLNPTRDLLVYDIRAAKWHRWNLHTTSNFSTTSNNINGQLFWIDSTNAQPRWIWAGIDISTLNAFSTTALTDTDTSSAAVAIPAQVQTSWLDFDAPDIRKALNALEISTKQTGAADCTVSVDAAETNADFTAPISIVSAATLYATPAGDWAIRLADQKTRYKWYRFTINFPTSSAAVTDNLIERLSIEWAPLQTS